MKNNKKNVLLEVSHLDVYLNTYNGRVHPVRDVSFSMRRGETLVLVGESGCGKTMLAKSIMRLLPEQISEIGENAQILFEGRDILQMSKKELQHALRGDQVAMIFQDPSTFLNPTMTIGKQVSECLRLHNKGTKKESYQEALALLQMVKITDPEKRLQQYPHELSGGMKQRVMIAIALACRPKLLIADEPTTALDVTTQADIMELLLELQEKIGTAILLVTHDLGLAAEIGDRVHVMYAGEIMETGTSKQVFAEKGHPYKEALLRSVPTNQSRVKERLYSLYGTPPDLRKEKCGCSFAPRCKECMRICLTKEPPLIMLEEEKMVACWQEHPLAKKIRKGGTTGGVSA